MSQYLNFSIAPKCRQNSGTVNVENFGRVQITKGLQKKGGQIENAKNDKQRKQCVLVKPWQHTTPTAQPNIDKKKGIFGRLMLITTLEGLVPQDR